MAVVIPVQADDSQFLAAMSGLQDSVEKSASRIVNALEGMAKKSTKAVDGLSEAEKKASGAAKALEAANKEAAKATREVGDSFGDTGSSAGKLAGALDLVYPGMGEIARNVADLSDVGEVATKALSGLGLSMKGLMAAAGPLAAVVAAAAFAYSQYTTYTDKAKEATKNAAKAAADASSDYKKLDDALFKARTQAQLIAGSITEVEAAQRLAAHSIGNEWAPSLAKARDAIEGTRAKLAELTKTIEDDGQATTEQLAEKNRLRKELGLAEDNYDGLNAAVNTLIETEGKSIQASKDKKDALKGESTAVKEAKKDLIAYKDALFELQHLIAEGQIAPGAKDIRNASAAMVVLTARLGDTLSTYGLTEKKSIDFDQALLDLKLAAIDLDTAFSRGTITQAEYAQGQADNKAAVDATTDAIQKQAEATQKAADDAVKATEDIQSAQAGAIGQAQSGLASIVSMIAGPVAGAIVGLVMNFGQTVSDLADELMSLPKILTDIPTQAAGLVTTILQDVVPGLLKALPDIATSLLAMIPTVIYGVVDAIPLIITAVVEAIPTLIQAVIMGLPGIVVAILSIIPLLIVNFGKVLKVEFMKGFAWVTEQGIPKLVRSFADGMRDLFNSLIEQIVGTFTDIFSRDGKSKQAYGDTPGMRRAGPQGQRLQASAGDYFAFSRTKQGLVDQALAGLVRSPQPAMAGGGGTQPVLVLNDSIRAFDGLNLQLSRSGRGLGTDIAVTARNRGR